MHDARFSVTQRDDADAQRGQMVKRPWIRPAVTQLPKLSELTLQSPTPIPGGGGPGGGGSTVVP